MGLGGPAPAPGTLNTPDMESVVEQDSTDIKEQVDNSGDACFVWAWWTEYYSLHSMVIPIF